jgi:hypothetical protein
MQERTAEFEDGLEGGEAGGDGGDNLEFGEREGEGGSAGGAAPRAARKGAAGSFPWSGTDRCVHTCWGPAGITCCKHVPGCQG